MRDWREINKNLFSALKLEKIATFIILSIAILVASFCIICTLLLMVTEKGKEIAILKAVGATDGAILRIFMIEGMIIGAIGTVFGVVTGLAFCTGALVVRRAARSRGLLHRSPPGERERQRLRRRSRSPRSHLHALHDLSRARGLHAKAGRRAAL